MKNRGVGGVMVN